jgi:glycosyltransferase involved in cell wall biosynthesis
LIAALRGLADDEALRQDLAARGLARSRLFTWEKAVRQTWEVYEEAVRRFP